MIKKKIVALLIVSTMLLTNISIAYGLDTKQVASENSNGDISEVVDTDSSNSDNKADSDVVNDEGNSTDGDITSDDESSNDSIIEDEGDDGTTQDDAAAVPKPEVIAEPQAAAATQNYFVKDMSSSGELDNVSGYATCAEANTAMKNAYAQNGDKGLVVTNSSNKIINMASGIAYIKSSKPTVDIGKWRFRLRSIRINLIQWFRC